MLFDSLIPVFIFIIQIVNSLPDIENDGIHNENHKVFKRSDVPRLNQITLVFVIDVAKAEYNTFETIRNEIHLIVDKFYKHDKHLVYDYVFLQSNGNGL